MSISFMESHSESHSAPDAEFTRAFLRHQQALFCHILTLMPRAGDAEEILQETALAMWRKHEQYDPEQSFLAWAKKFAHFEILKFRKRNNQLPHFLTDGLLDVLAQVMDQSSISLKERQQALQNCLDALPSKDRDLLKARYFNDSKLEEVSKKLGRSVNALSKALERTRHKLHECITRKLQGGES